MRTWSVRGTAFALWTRSSSLSMSTRTSIPASLIGRPENALLERVAKPEHPLRARESRPHRPCALSVRGSDHDALLARRLAALVLPQERDLRPVTRPRRRVSVPDQHPRPRAVRVDGPDISVAVEGEPLAVRRPGRIVPDGERPLSAPIGMDEDDLALERELGPA